MRDDDTFRTWWCEVDPRIAALWPSAGRIARTSEHALVEDGTLTRTLEVVACELDPLVELSRVVDELHDFELAIYDCGVLAKADGITISITARRPTYEIQVELVGDGIDLRTELDRHAALAPVATIVELGDRVTRLESTCVPGHAPVVAFAISLDDDSKHGLVAWLAAQDLTPNIAVMVGDDEANVYVRPASRRAFAHGTDAEGVAMLDLDVDPSQIVEETENEMGPEGPIPFPDSR